MTHPIIKSTLFLSLCFLFIVNADSRCDEISLETVQAAFEKPIHPHPRLFMTGEQEKAVLHRIETTPELKSLYANIIDRANEELSTESVERILKGRRLLSMSRRCLGRILNLSMAYRFSRDKRYLERAEQEMLAAAGFSDWNPNHFLDVAEMTAALAIGYDWLYDDLAPESRVSIEKAILEKGINPSLNENAGSNWWIESDGNWSQVCNTGMTLGALAVMEDHPELAKRLVHRAVNKIQIVMAEYDPDGAYPEGPMYWCYGTTYNVFFIAALDSVFQTDFGLSQKPGFSKTADYYRHMIGPSGVYFNYSDCGRHRGYSPAVFWFAERYQIPGWAKQELTDISRTFQKQPKSSLGYLNSLSLIWAQADTARHVPSLCWMGRGVTPVAAFRTRWTDPDAGYFAIKAGTPSAHHAHMDIGSFVYEADGVRWAVDLGPESYYKIESLGMNLWGREQNSDRWTIFRYSNLSHNTLVVNNQLQQVKGKASIIQFSDNQEFPHVIIDMTDVYAGQLSKAHRGGALLPTEQLLIQDELEATDQPATVRWAMATPADIQIQSNRSALLTLENRALTFEILTDPKTQLEVISTQPKTTYDSPNPGTRMIGFIIHLEPSQKTTLAVLMTPEHTIKSPIKPVLKPLAAWSKK